MPRTRLGRLAIASASFLVLIGHPDESRAEGPLIPAIGPSGERQPVPGRSGSVRASGDPASGSGGWWMGTAGIAGALAVVGGLSLASKRFLPARDSGPLRVVGRASLSPKHSVYLVRVGDRVLILGAGPQGPPSALGEVTDPGELARLVPRRGAAPGSGPVSTLTSPSFDRRIGDDE